MKYKRTIPVIFISLFLLLIIAGIAVTDSVLAITLPFVWISQGLRTLSLSGALGNAAAILLYLVLSALPLAGIRTRKFHAEDLLLPVAVLCNLYTFYYLINPALRPVPLSGSTGTLISVGAVYLVLLSWLIIRTLRGSDQMGIGIIYRLLRYFLTFCGAICIVSGFVLGIADLVRQITDLRAGNTMPGLNLVPTYIFQFLRFGVNALAYSLNALLLFLGVRFLKVLEQDPYSEACTDAAVQTSKWCRTSLVVILLSHLTLNLGQLLCAPVLHQLSISFQLPLLSVAVAFIMIILTRLLQQGKQIKEDNDLFI